jgi:hypothetical protein
MPAAAVNHAAPYRALPYPSASLESPTLTSTSFIELFDEFIPRSSVGDPLLAILLG